MTHDMQAQKDTGKETSVLEFIEVVQTTSKEMTKDTLPPVMSKAQSYIKVISPAVLAALRHVVNYYPSQNLDGERVIIKEPYAVVVHHEDELEKYRQKFAFACSSGEPKQAAGCANRYAYKHIGVLLDFVRDKVGEAVKAERERSARGCSSRNMMWLMLKPGTDVYYDEDDNDDYEPYVVKSCNAFISDGRVVRYTIRLWKLDVSTDFTGQLGLNTRTICHSGGNGEYEIVGGTVFPCAFWKDGVINGRRASEFEKSLVDRGRMFHRLQRKGCFHFQGTSMLKPTRAVSHKVQAS